MHQNQFLLWKRILLDGGNDLRGWCEKKNSFVEVFGYTAVEEANESNGWIDIVDIWDDQSMPVWREEEHVSVFGVRVGGSSSAACSMEITAC